MQFHLRRAMAAIAMLLPAVCAQAAEIRVIASPSVSAILRELGPRFESSTGHKLAASYGLVPMQKQRIEAGDFDLAIVPGEVMKYEVAQGRISAQAYVEIAQTGLGVGIPNGAAKPDLGTLEGFKRTLLDAKSVAYVAKEPSGKQVEQDFESLGIAAAIKSRIISKESTGQVWQAVAGGEAGLGFGFIPNVKSAAGVSFAGPFPRDLQFYTVIAAGVGAAAQQPDAAKAFITYLTGADAGAVFAANGFEPVPPAGPVGRR